ncbi:MAG: 6-hydroxymethylpterin diphosphokinase MptE-like protein [Sulfolobales archaeon]
MNLKDPLFWEGVYDRILTSLGFDRDRDYFSCRVLDLLLSSRMGIVAESQKRLVELLQGRTAIVVGDSTGSGCPRPQGGVLVVADAAFEKCLEEGVVPDIVTTDLDGIPESSLRARDTLFVVHAHGDNVEYLERFLPYVGGQLIGTAQYKCSHRVEVPGGFTDGDRAVFLAYYYGAKRVFIYGFDFSSVGRWIKPSGVQVNATIKLAKLAWSRILLLLLKDLGYEIECLENSCEGWI